MVPRHEDGPDAEIAAYSARFESLLALAERLNIHPDVAEQLVADVLIASLLKRSIENMDLWLVGALTYAARGMQ